MLDDTAYFLPFETLEHAAAVHDMLQSDTARQFLNAMVFWDEKRPITVELLKRLDIKKLAAQLGRGDELDHMRAIGSKPDVRQLRMFA